MTGAEWITKRFGNDKGSKLSHMVVIFFAIISAIGFIAYFFVGIGKFATIFFPKSWDLTTTIAGLTISSENMYAVIIFAITTLYVIKGGMYSVVATEVMQFVIMTIACILVAYFAMDHVSADQLNAAVPAGWKDFWPSWEMGLDWSGIFDQVNDKIGKDGFGLLGALLMMMIFKGIFASLAGPVPSYDMQRVLATETPRDAAKMASLTSLVLFPARYLMIAGVAVLALVFVTPILKTQGADADFEQVLPLVINNYLPIGVKGIIMAGLLAAFMSTFSAFVNSAPAYIVNDFYKKYINPNASDKKYVKISYLSSIGVVLVGTIFGFFADSINSLTLWITSSLYGGYAAANVLKWIWWRFNGYGYFWGMASGLIAATFKFLFFPDIADIYLFPIILAFSFIGSFVGCLLTKPTDDETIIDFYKDVRPWGFWGKAYDKAKLVYPNITKNNDFGRDMLNVVIGIVWQMSLVIAPIYLVIREWNALIISIVVCVVCSVILKFNWLDKVKDYEDA
jgi:Na+/proline symporter